MITNESSPYNIAQHYNRISAIPDYSERWRQITMGYAESGFPGVSYVKTESDLGISFESILFRNRQGELLAVLDYFSSDGFPNERRGSINVVVHPQYQKMGIGSELLKRAVEKWSIGLNAQEWTPTGFKLLNSFLNANSR